MRTSNEGDIKQAVEKMSKWIRENEARVLSSHGGQPDATVLASDEQETVK